GRCPAARTGPLGAHDRHALSCRCRLSGRRRQRAEDRPNGPPPGRHARAAGPVRGRGAGGGLRSLGPARRRSPRSPALAARPSARLVPAAPPIGTPGVPAPRAAATWAEADAVVCEATRRTGRLLQHAGVSARRLVVANQHTEARAAAEVVRLLGQGRTVAVVT